MPEKPQRMTDLSRSNLKAAERVELYEFESGGVGLKAWRGDRAAVICTGSGPARWADAKGAFRALRRVRRDIEPTTI